MAKNRLWGTALLALVAGGFLIMPGVSEAQRGKGWGWGSGGYDPWGYHSQGSRSNYVSPAPVINQQALYPSEESTNPMAAGFLVRVPDANTEIFFENQKTQQKGLLRQFISGSLDPNYDYTFHIRARWTDNGRAVDQSRDIVSRAGQQTVVDFT